MLAHRILGGCSSNVSISCPSLGSELIAMAHACLWSSCRECSAFCGQMGKESPLLMYPETMVSCLLSRSRVFPRLPPGYLWYTSPLQAMFMQPTPVLFLGSDFRSWSLSSQPPPTLAGEQTSLCAGISALCPLHPCCCALFCGSKVSPPTHTLSPPVKGLLSVWKPFLLHSSFPEVQVLSLFFCLRFFFFLFPYAGRWGFCCLLGSLRSSTSVQ